MTPTETKEKLWDVVCGHCGFVAGKVAYRERIHHMEVDHPSHQWSVFYNGFGFYLCQEDGCKKLVARNGPCPYCHAPPSQDRSLFPAGGEGLPVRVVD